MADGKLLSWCAGLTRKTTMMLPIPANKEASTGARELPHACHWSEQTLLYRSDKAYSPVCMSGRRTKPRNSGACSRTWPYWWMSNKGRAPLFRISGRLGFDAERRITGDVASHLPTVPGLFMDGQSRMKGIHFLYQPEQGAYRSG